MKQCTKCGLIKDCIMFHKDKQKPDGYTSCCKQCRKEDAKKYYGNNKEAVFIRKKKWQENNKEKHIQTSRAYHKKYRQENLERLKEYDKQRIENNKEYFVAKARKRYASKLKRTPPWLSKEQIKEMQTEYELAAWVSSVMGVKYHVDHIVPLQGKNVCGLHVPWNLRVIPATENIKKGNKHDEGQWE